MMEEKLAQMKQQADVVQRHLDAISGLIWLMGTATSPRQVELLRECLEIESEKLRVDSASLDDTLKDIKEARRLESMKRTSTIVPLMILFALLLMVVSVSAQESTEAPTPTQEVTAAPTAEVTPVPEPEQPDEETPVIIDQGGFRVGTFGFIATIVTLLLGGAGIGAAWATIRNSKQAKDNLELAYESTSPKTQEDIRKGYEVAERAWDRVDQLAREVLKFFEEVTDKEPNEETPPTSLTKGGNTWSPTDGELRG